MKEILNESNIFAQQKYNYVDFKLMINDFSFSLSSFFFFPVSSNVSNVHQRYSFSSRQALLHALLKRSIW